MGRCEASMQKTGLADLNAQMRSEREVLMCGVAESERHRSGNVSCGKIVVLT